MNSIESISVRMLIPEAKRWKNERSHLQHDVWYAPKPMYFFLLFERKEY